MKAFQSNDASVLAQLVVLHKIMVISWIQTNCNFCLQRFVHMMFFVCKSSKIPTTFRHFWFALARSRWKWQPQTQFGSGFTPLPQCAFTWYLVYFVVGYCTKYTQICLCVAFWILDGWSYVESNSLLDITGSLSHPIGIKYTPSYQHQFYHYISLQHVYLMFLN